jgi:hypothetical protein
MIKPLPLADVALRRKVRLRPVTRTVTHPLLREVLQARPRHDAARVASCRPDVKRRRFRSREGSAREAPRPNFGERTTPEARRMLSPPAYMGWRLPPRHAFRTSTSEFEGAGSFARDIAFDLRERRPSMWTAIGYRAAFL